MKEILQFPSGAVSCDLSYSGACQAYQMFFETYGMVPCYLRVSPMDEEVADTIAKTVLFKGKLIVEVSNLVAADAWELTDGVHEGFGSGGV